MVKMIKAISPDFKIDLNKIPTVKIKSIAFKNFKVFENVTFNFCRDDECENFTCFFGPNGCGKTTVLDAISIIFSKYDGRDIQRLTALLGKSVRHVDGVQRAVYDKDTDFLITAQIECSLGDYEVQLTKSGFIKDHPDALKEIIQRICFYAKFDQELHQFQLLRKKWNIFKELFGAVTGFSIEEITTPFNAEDSNLNSPQDDILRKYVLGFTIHKPNEIINHKECSAGERKIIKSFSTLLNKEVNPAIVCIDNAEMHVESGRHIQLIESMKKCFPQSQIFATTHSYQISRNFGNRNQLYDMRMIKANDIIKYEPWRLYVSDEIKDNISKIKSFATLKNKELYVLEGEQLVERCLNSKDDFNLRIDCEDFLEKIPSFFIEDIMYCYGSKK